MKKDTILSHAGRDSQRFDGAVNTPVVRASTILFPTLASYETAGRHKFDSIRYGIHGTHTKFALEQAVALLEGGHRAVALPSGLAAITAPVLALTRAGDHILVVDSVYGPTRNFCETSLKRNGVETTYYDPLAGAGIAGLIRPNTKLVFCESPGSLTFEVQDIPAIARAAHARDIPVLADNTWGTPYFFSAFERGVDISIHAATKYIVGHSDAMLGIVVTNEKYWMPVRQAVSDYGFATSPDDCYLGLRGLRTMGVRLKQHQQSALIVARWLQQRPEVARVIYPALEGDAGYALWKRDFSGACSLFGIVLRPVAKTAVARMIDSLQLFGIGSSWGGFESLITNPDPRNIRSATRWSEEGPLVRLHIGLEDPEDLIADLQHGLEQLRAG
jgi:cystathionine beta-lyase